MRTRIRPLAAIALLTFTLSAATASAQAGPEIPWQGEPIEEGGLGGGVSVPQGPAFNPPSPAVLFRPNLPLIAGVALGVPYSCNQIPHVGIAPSNDVVRGTTLYAWGVAAPGSRANFGFYNQSGQLVKNHNTKVARSNCVIHHEPEAIDTSGFSPGYYYVYASYWSVSTTGFDDFYGAALGHLGWYITALRIR